MSKGYAIALIFTTLSVFGSLFYLQHQVLTERHAATFTYAEEVSERVIGQKREQLDELVMKTVTLLSDDTKHRFRPILPFISLAQEGEKELIGSAESLTEDDPKALIRLLQLKSELLVTLSDSAIGLISASGHLMDLNPDDIKVKTSNLREIIDRTSSPPTDYFSKHSLNLQRDLILLDYLNILEEVLLDVTQISGGKVISCFFGPEFFPVISSQFANPQLGETIHTKLSIGSYATSLKRENAFILVSGDTLRMGLDGTADFNFKATKRGRQKFKMELFLKNPLTGAVRQESTSDYSYFVR